MTPFVVIARSQIAALAAIRRNRSGSSRRRSGSPPVMRTLRTPTNANTSTKRLSSSNVRMSPRGSQVYSSSGMQYRHRRLHRSVTDRRRSRSGRPNVSTTRSSSPASTSSTPRRPGEGREVIGVVRKAYRAPASSPWKTDAARPLEVTRVSDASAAQVTSPKTCVAGTTSSASRPDTVILWSRRRWTNSPESSDRAPQNNQLCPGGPWAPPTQQCPPSSRSYDLCQGKDRPYRRPGSAVGGTLRRKRTAPPAVCGASGTLLHAPVWSVGAEARSLKPARP